MKSTKVQIESKSGHNSKVLESNLKIAARQLLYFRSNRVCWLTRILFPRSFLFYCNLRFENCLKPKRSEKEEALQWFMFVKRLGSCLWSGFGPMITTRRRESRGAPGWVRHSLLILLYHICIVLTKTTNMYIYRACIILSPMCGAISLNSQTIWFLWISKKWNKLSSWSSPMGSKEARCWNHQQIWEEGFLFEGFEAYDCGAPFCSEALWGFVVKAFLWCSYWVHNLWSCHCKDMGGCHNCYNIEIFLINNNYKNILINYYKF